MIKFKKTTLALASASVLTIAIAGTGYSQNTSESTASNPVTTVAVAAGKTHMLVHKDPNCGCCKGWVEQLSSSFVASVNNTGDITAIKDKYNLSLQHRSCHTAVTDDGFVFEGHIPNAAIESFLANPPEGALGLAVPGMPIGSPGMEVGNKTMRYPIHLLNKDGSSDSVYAYATGKIVEG
ncbi:MAG: DUF411 domain-containing protein [Pseudomonadales bacterium]|nr:DUF411 domain-containing protein [Pseudomonadales bacterium]NRA17560.1 DUF411 domain-containing protein [Oceanospirillaceae bacterium]